MLSSRRVAFAAAVAFAVVGILAAYLFLELGESNDQLASTRTTLADTQTTLDDTRTTLHETDAALSEQAALNAGLTAANRTLETDKAAVETANATLETDKAAVETANATLEASLSQSRRENSDLTGQNAALSRNLQESTEQTTALVAGLGTLKSEYAALTTNHRELGLEHEGLRVQHASLQESAGTADSLAAKVEALRQEIRDLEEMREPLILGPGSSWRSGFYCTGSMEPVITCLDEARWLGDFEAEDIVVGSTISYDPGCGDDEPDGRWTAHRVMQVEVRDGVHYYWPKGDNNRNADGCWIAEQSIRAYIVEIYEDVRPANALLRVSVNRAKEAMDSAGIIYGAAGDYYDELRVRFCGDRTWDNCPLPDYQYNEAIAQYRIVEQARVLFTQAIDHWQCWVRNAKESERPGHIPHEC